jgi:hypothetical protein
VAGKIMMLATLTVVSVVVVATGILLGQYRQMYDDRVAMVEAVVESALGTVDRLERPSPGSATSSRACASTAARTISSSTT